MNLLIIQQKGAAAFVVSNSGDFETSESDVLTASITGNVDKWTAAWWEKRESTGAAHSQLGGDAGEMYVQYNATDNLVFNNTSSNYRLSTTATYTDTTNWHHWVVIYDSGNATAGDRMKIYYDGVEVTAFDTDTMPPQNTDGDILGGGTNYIGELYGGYGQHFDGLIAEFYLISDQVLTPSSFISGTGGSAVAIEFTGSFGANDTYLKFANGANLGEDSSGGNNDWTNTGVTQSSTVPST